MSRRFLFLVLTLMACSFFVVGCGGSDGSDGAPGSNPSVSDLINDDDFMDSIVDAVNSAQQNLTTDVTAAKAAIDADASLDTVLGGADNAELQSAMEGVADSTRDAVAGALTGRASTTELNALLDALQASDADLYAAFVALLQEVAAEGADAKFSAVTKVFKSAKRYGYSSTATAASEGKIGSVYAGANACLTCHTGTLIEEHVASKHVTHSSYVNASSDASCQVCHDPLDEGIWFEAYLDSVPAGGLAAVTCETCHGMSSQHVSAPGAYKPQFPEPKAEQCGTCHSSLPADHIPHHPLADQITERYLTSNHADNPRSSGTCGACHSHEGFLARNTAQRAIAKTAGALASTYSDVFASGNVEASSVGCNTCHDDHTFDLRTQATLNDLDEVVYSEQFNLCTSCHQVDLDENNQLSSAYAHANSPATSDTVGYHTDSHQERHFVDTHFAGLLSKDVYYADVKDGRDENGFYHAQVSHGGTQYDVLNDELDAYYAEYQAAADDIVIAGYNINPASPTACSSCHDVHSANVMRSSEETVLAYDQNFEERISVAIDAAEGIGATHGDYTKSAFGYAVREGCMPCHTGMEIIPETIGGHASFTEGETEGRLGCITCHDMVNIGEDFAVTDTRTFEADHTFDFVTEDAEGNAVVLATLTAEDLGQEQICFECHKGRVGVRPTADTATAVYDVMYLHYAPIFATMFGADSGAVPTYAGKEYVGRFAHFDGEEFSCADCHDVHTTEAKMDKAGETCNGCHGSGALASVANLKARTQAFSDRLFATIYALTPDALYTMLVDGVARFADGKTEDNLHTILTSRAEASELGSTDLAKAGAIWTIFTYNDGYYAEGHGHGASWAHNSKFARQLMYDAIEALGGDLTGLERP